MKKLLKFAIKSLFVLNRISKWHILIFVIFLSSHVSSQIIKIYSLDSYDKAFLEQVNQHRSVSGLSHLFESKELNHAANHHAMYLAMFYEMHGYFGNHKENYDLENFTEYYHASERPGNPAAEIIDHALFDLEYKNQSAEEIISESDGLKQLTQNPKTMFITDYVNSPPHRSILESSFENNEIGTCSLLILIRSKTPDFPEYIKCYLLNVTTMK